jgi:hypothetical protein
LKAPFHLQENFELTDLMTRMDALAKQLHPVELGTLSAVKMGQFVALVPQTMNTQLTTLAEKCVTELDDLRAPLTAQEIARRQVDVADERGQFLLQQYGYPRVLERFIFHFTLSARVEPCMADRIVDLLHNPVQHLNESSPLVLDRLCLFVEDAPGQSFRRIADMVLVA